MPNRLAHLRRNLRLGVDSDSVVTSHGRADVRAVGPGGGMERVAVGLLGLGTVGAGVVRLMKERAEAIAARAGRRVEIKWAVVRDPKKRRAAPIDEIEVVTDPRRVIDDPDVSVVVETMGGTDPTLQVVLDALAAGKDVVTANKALLAEHGARRLRPGQKVRPGRGVRGERRRRHPDRPGARGRPRGQPGARPWRRS